MVTSSTVRVAVRTVEVVFLEKLAGTVTVDQVDRRGAITDSFLPGICGKRSRGDQQALAEVAEHRLTRDDLGPQVTSGLLLHPSSRTGIERPADHELCGQMSTKYAARCPPR